MRESQANLPGNPRRPTAFHARWPTALVLFLLCLSPLRAAPRLSFLENEEIKVGIDLDLGGAITWLSGRDGENRINNFDHGRQVQLSYFSGPVPFEVPRQKPAGHWRHLGWNPIQAGDDFDHGSRILEHQNDGGEIYVKCVPLQWPLNQVEGECTFESWLTLEGKVVKARARLVNARSDPTQYPARLQELPAVYANAAFHRVVSYTGPLPYSGEPATSIPPPATRHPWSFWLGTEQWSALLDGNDQGIGLITPGRIWFTGGFAGRPGHNDTKANDTGYLAGQGLEILDHNIVHEFSYELVVGSLEEIRVRASAHAPAKLPSWRFENDRQGWHYRDARDTGWPISGSLEVIPDGPDPQLVSPPVLWQAEEAPWLIIEASFPPETRRATVYWRHWGQDTPGAEDHLDFPLPEGGQISRHVLHLGGRDTYKGPLVQLRLDPATSGDGSSRVRVKSISLHSSPP
ncbi:MAG: hypothetical protein KDN18_07910 [Verrucomicrobiae bacterium]|nr:hypothetical protein [Verrucomicrobiae bacterium]